MRELKLTSEFYNLSALTSFSNSQRMEKEKVGVSYQKRKAQKELVAISCSQNLIVFIVQYVEILSSHFYSLVFELYSSNRSPTNAILLWAPNKKRMKDTLIKDQSRRTVQSQNKFGANVISGKHGCRCFEEVPAVLEGSDDSDAKEQ